MRLKVLLMALPAIALPPITYHVLPTWFGEGYLFWIVDVLVRLMVPLFCLLMLYRQGIGPRDYGLPASLGSCSVAEFVSLSFICTLAFLTSIVVDNVVRYSLKDSGADFTDLGVPRGQAGLLAVLYYVITASFIEEIFFRGILGVVFLTDRRRITTAIYITVSAAAFTVAHSASNLTSIISILYLGIVSATFYVLLRNLWPLVIAHLVTDTIIFWWIMSKSGVLLK